MSIEESGFVQRVERVLHFLEKMAAGNMAVRIPLSKKRDHLDALAFGINLLADEIQYKQSQDRKHREELMAAQQRLESAKKKLEETQVKLIETAKLAALGEISAGMAHEINNPLIIIGGVMEKMELSIESDGFQRNEALSDIRLVFDQIHRIGSIVNQVKGFARQSDQEFKVIDICQLIETSCQLYSKQLALQNVEIVISLPEEEISVRGRANRLEQVFINLLNNAKDAIGSRGSSQYSGKITVGVDTDGERVKISFGDNGVGMESDVLSRIFDPFFTTKEDGKGTGLGLSISHEIVDSHGGTIAIESTPMNGTRVLIVLPLYAKDRQ